MSIGLLRSLVRASAAAGASASTVARQSVDRLANRSVIAGLDVGVEDDALGIQVGFQPLAVQYKARLRDRYLRGRGGALVVRENVQVVGRDLDRFAIGVGAVRVDAAAQAH